MYMYMYMCTYSYSYVHCYARVRNRAQGEKWGTKQERAGTRKAASTKYYDDVKVNSHGRDEDVYRYK